MVRKNLMIDDQLLFEAKRLLGAESNSATVNQSLKLAIKLARIEGIASFFGTGIWQGDLEEMREDRRPSKKRGS